MESRPRRSQSMPHSQLARPRLSSLSSSTSSGSTDRTILYEHGNARITKFEWKDQKIENESFLSCGNICLYTTTTYRVTFLESGKTVHPLMKRSRCWELGEGRFAFKVGGNTFWRVEIVEVVKGCHEKANEFREVLTKEAYFEKEPCPFRDLVVVEDSMPNVQAGRYRAPRRSIIELETDPSLLKKKDFSSGYLPPIWSPSSVPTSSELHQKRRLQRHNSVASGMSLPTRGLFEERPDGVLERRDRVGQRRGHHRNHSLQCGMSSSYSNRVVFEGGTINSPPINIPSPRVQQLQEYIPSSPELLAASPVFKENVFDKTHDLQEYLPSSPEDLAAAPVFKENVFDETRDLPSLSPPSPPPTSAPTPEPSYAHLIQQHTLPRCISLPTIPHSPPQSPPPHRSPRPKPTLTITSPHSSDVSLPSLAPSADTEEPPLSPTSTRPTSRSSTTPSCLTNSDSDSESYSPPSSPHHFASPHHPRLSSHLLARINTTLSSLKGEALADFLCTVAGRIARGAMGFETRKVGEGWEGEGYGERYGWEWEWGVDDEMVERVELGERVN